MAIITPRRTESGWNGFQPAMQYDQEQRKINEQLEAVCLKSGAILVPMHLAFKQGDAYHAFGTEYGNRVPLYRDQNHLSPAGSLRAAEFIMPYLFPEKGTEP